MTRRLTMKISRVGLALIKRFEGLELDAYQDIAGVWTIGFGHTETARAGQRITPAEADALLAQDLEKREQSVRDLVTVALNQNEFDALVSFVYNVGAAAFGGSTARRRLNQGDRAGAADALTWWNKATVDGALREVAGLTRRRAAERDLFLKPVAPPPEIVLSDVEGCVAAPGRCAERSVAPSIVAPQSRRPSLPFLKGLFACGKF